MDKFDLLFKKIDNQVKIYYNNAVIWQSDVIHNDPDLNLKVPLNNFFQPGKNTITVKLYNAPSTQYNPWKISYDILKNGAFDGNVSDSDASNQGPGNNNEGEKFSKTHTFTI